MLFIEAFDAINMKKVPVTVHYCGVSKGHSSAHKNTTSALIFQRYINRLVLIDIWDS